MNQQKVAELLENEEFLEFVLRAAEDMIVHATTEDLAVFGFGSLDDAIEAFAMHKAEG